MQALLLKLAFLGESHPNLPWETFPLGQQRVQNTKQNSYQEIAGLGECACIISICIMLKLLKERKDGVLSMAFKIAVFLLIDSTQCMTEFYTAPPLTEANFRLSKITVVFSGQTFTVSAIMRETHRHGPTHPNPLPSCSDPPIQRLVHLQSLSWEWQRSSLHWIHSSAGDLEQWVCFWRSCGFLLGQKVWSVSGCRPVDSPIIQLCKLYTSSIVKLYQRVFCLFACLLFYS